LTGAKPYDKLKTIAKTLVYYLPDDDTFILITREGPNLIMETGDIKTALVSLSPRKNPIKLFTELTADIAEYIGEL